MYWVGGPLTGPSPPLEPYKHLTAHKDHAPSRQGRGTRKLDDQSIKIARTTAPKDTKTQSRSFPPFGEKIFLE